MCSGHKIVERLDDLLKSKNLRRKDIADACGVSTQALTHWSKQGSIPAADTAIKMAQYLNVSVEWLITGEDPDDLSGEERTLLSKWSMIPLEAKNALMAQIDYHVAECKKNNVQIS